VKHNQTKQRWAPQTVDPDVERRAAAVATAVLKSMPDELGTAHTWEVVELSAKLLKEFYARG
jgi:hypothetical protein